VVYGRSFRRITNGMTRSREHAADAHAASIVGKGAVVTGLRSMHAAAAAYTVYWTREVVPVLDAGFRPPITAGFELFRHAPTTRAEIARQLESDAAHSQATPDDSYPTLAERTQAIEALPDASAPIATDDRRAIGLLRGISEVELQILRFTGGEGPAGELKPIVFRNRDATATPVTVDPFESMCALSEGRLGGSEWDSICQAFRIDTVALESAAAARQIEEVAHADGAPR